jgi:hypothetical protein
MSNEIPPFTTACELRPIRFLELWQPVGWRLKVYGIAYGRPMPRAELISAAKETALRLLKDQAAATKHYSVGFLGVRDGRNGGFVFVDWWADENELHHHFFISPSDEPTQLFDRTATGPHACVWDLRVIGFERDAWLASVLRNPGGPDVDGYLASQLNEDA